jgi:hypothetical protein
LFEVTAILWKRVTHHYRNVGFGLPLVVLGLLYPAIAPCLRPFRFPNDRASEIAALILNTLYYVSAVDAR